jgi:hypothetical protein
MILLIGGVGGGVLVLVMVLVTAFIGSVAELSEDSDTENAKLQFSVVQQQDDAPAPPRGDDFERRTAAYAAGEKRLEEEQSGGYVSSTSFGSGFRRKEEAAAASAPDPEPEAAAAKPLSPSVKGKAKKKPAAAQPSAADPPAPPPQQVRAKRTRYAEAEAPAAAQEQGQAQGAQKTSFRAKIFEDVEVVNSAYVKIRVLQDFEYDGCTVRRNAMLTAEARRGSRSVDILLYSLMACGRRMSVSFTAYSLDGVQGLPVREDNAAEVGVKEGRSEAVTGAASGVASRASGIMGIVGSAVAAGVSGGARASQQVQPVLVEEGREIIFMMN